NSRVATITAFSRILLYPWVAFDVVTQTTHTSLQDRPSPISPVSVPPRRTPPSPTSSIHSPRPPIPPLRIMPSRSSPASPDPGPGSLTPPHPPSPRSRSYAHLRS
ncbi:hypothetical protein EDB83DRAFT_2468244, partial [Lactarius deliciosus]